MQCDGRVPCRRLLSGAGRAPVRSCALLLDLRHAVAHKAHFFPLLHSGRRRQNGNYFALRSRNIMFNCFNCVETRLRWKRSVRRGKGRGVQRRSFSTTAVTLRHRGACVHVTRSVMKTTPDRVAGVTCFSSCLSYNERNIVKNVLTHLSHPLKPCVPTDPRK